MTIQQANQYFAALLFLTFWPVVRLRLQRGQVFAASRPKKMTLLQLGQRQYLIMVYIA